MKIQNSEKVGLFLHMGPGQNAQVEKKLLQQHFKNILFFDQPKTPNKLNAFNDLVESCHEQIKILYKKNNDRPVHIMAHSFGGHLANQLLNRCPELIESCDMYSTGYDIPAGFFKLLRTIGESTRTNIHLKNEIIDYIKLTQPNSSNHLTNMWSYIGLIAKDPSYFTYYWPNDKLLQNYLNIAAHTDPIDMLSFQNVLSDFLETKFNPTNPAICNWTGPMTIYLGDNDPLINIDHETKIWNKIFIQAKIKSVNNSSHFIHLEPFLSE